MLYLIGEGVDKNVELALAWLESSAKQDFEPATETLSDLNSRLAQDKKIEKIEIDISQL